MTNRYMKAQVITPYVQNSFAVDSANVHILDVSGEDITENQGFIYPKTASSRTMRHKIQGPVKISGPLDMPLFPTHATSLLYYVLGAVATQVDTPSAGVNTHTITKANTIPFFQAAYGRDQVEHQYTGAMMKGMTVDFKPTDTLSASFDVVYREEFNPPQTLSTVTFPDYNVAERAFGTADMATLISATGTSPAVTAVTFIEGLTCKYENGVADSAFALSSQYLPAGIVAGVQCTGSMDLRYDSDANYLDFLTGSEKSLTITCAYGALTAKRQIQLNIPVLSYDSNKLPTKNIERYVQTLGYTAETDGNGNPINFAVVNALTNAQFIG